MPLTPCIAKLDTSAIDQVIDRAIDHLVGESLAEGFQFVARLRQEFSSGLNCFDQPGEILLFATVQGAVVGMGGLNRDPYSKDAQIGRLRHLYVASAWRRQGVGRLLVTELIREASLHYRLLTLRTDAEAADAFYRALGFRPASGWEHTTHALDLS